MPVAQVISGRYELTEKPIGQGGMGVVYKAYDPVTRRNVALKTMRGPVDSAAFELFAKEWTVLAGLSHPNIVDILDTGEFGEGKHHKPFFVMPLLRGVTLEHLIQTASQRLTVERTVEIIVQTCRGLQAAHEQGVVHRDLKPSNIFVLDDDTVKIIDFGVVHLTGAESTSSLKGTLQYMAPEQIEMKPASQASDIFSLGVVCYEALTGRKPFVRGTEAETVQAIQHYIPPPVCEINTSVSQLVSRVIHKAMAKQPFHRFSSAKEFADTLQKALHNQPIERFERARMQPRIDRAKRAYQEGDLQFALEILTELEAEGNIDPEITVLHLQIAQAIRQKSIRQLLDSARTRFEEEEYPLAVQKVQEVLEIDAENSDALGLRAEIEKQRSERQIENWFRLVRQHMDNHAFSQARQGLQEILKINANETRASSLLAEVDRCEQEILRFRAEKEQLYQSALGSYQNGEISSALSMLERILELHRRSPDSSTPERDAQYQSFYNQVRSERESARNAYAEGRRFLGDRNFEKALETCNEYLNKYPGDPMFQALKLEAEELRRQEQSAYIAEVGRRAAAEANLDRRVNILKEAVERYPEEPHLQQSYRLTRDRRDLVNSIVGKARQYEERGQFSEALGQWDILRNIYEQYPGREFEVQRLARRREDQVRDEAKARWTEQVDRHLDAGEYARALEVAQNALTEFVGDRELAGLERLAQQCLERSEEAQKWLDEGQALCLDHRLGDGLGSLRKAAALDAKNVAIRAALLNALVEQARSLLGQDWQLAEPLVDQALALDPGHPLAKNLRAVIGDYQRQQITDNCVSQARELQTDGNPAAALAKVEEVLAVYPNDVRLMQIRSRLRNQVDTKKQDSPPARSTPSTVHPPASAGLSVSQATMNDFEPTDIEKTRLQPAPDTKKTLAVTAVPQQSRTEPNWSPRKVWRQVATAARGFHADRLRRIPSRYVAAALLPILLLAVVLLTRTREARQAPPEGRAYAIEFECNTDGAKVLVDGQAVSSGPVKLSPGVHEVVANKVGYQPLRKSFTLVPDRPAPTRISLELQPALANLCLFGDFNSGQISLDNQPIEQMQDGSFVKENVPLGEHTLKVFDAGQEQMSFAFRTDPGALAILTSPLNARGYEALVVSSLGEQARVYGSAPIKGGMPGEALRPLPAEGLPLTGLSPARNELAVDNGKGSRPISIDVGSVPAISIWVTSPSMGAVAVRANTPDAQIIVDGRTLRTPLRNSKAVISLKPGLYHIRVAKEGYPRVPEQNVEVKKGETRQIAFELKPGANTASLLIEGATPAAEVWIDGKQSGETGRDGAFSRQDLPPGAHTITLRKTDFEEHAFRREIAVGQTTHLSGPETQLKPFGALALKVTPANASLSYRREGDEQVREAVNGQVLRVRTGRYVINAKADRRTPHSETITVVPGRVTNVSWSLTTTVESRPAQNHLLQTKDYFENSNQWKSDGAWGEHDTPSTSWLERNQGLYTITVLRQSSNVLFLKRTKRVEWDADYRDENNRIQYWLDGHSLRRRHIVSGSVVSEIKQPVPDGSSYTFQIELRPDRVTVRGASGELIDEVKRTAPVALGKFGFRGEVALAIQKFEER